MTTSNPQDFHITFIRHGESVGNLENRMQGLRDYPLSETGRAQANALADRWQAECAGFDTVITSPLSRARETAEIISDKLMITAIRQEPVWVERDMGIRSGLTIDEIKSNHPYPEFRNPYNAAEDAGESDWALYLRAGQALQSLLKNPPGKYLVVTHGALLNMTLYAILGITPQPNAQGPRLRLENTALCSFQYHPDRHIWRVEVIGDRRHWPVNSGK